jgi:hypothetical protein
MTRTEADITGLPSSNTTFYTFRSTTSHSVLDIGTTGTPVSQITTATANKLRRPHGQRLEDINRLSEHRSAPQPQSYESVSTVSIQQPATSPS